MLASQLRLTNLAMLLVAASLPVPPTSGPAQAQEQAQRAGKSVHLWKSQTTGNEYRVSIEGDLLRAEWVNIPAELRRNGAYVRTECRRVGTNWVGTTRSRLRLPCTEVAMANGRHPLAWCSLVTRIELDSMSPDRITGRAQAPTRLDCHACKLLDAEWKSFTWILKP
jgi:hypothetical protein